MSEELIHTIFSNDPNSFFDNVYARASSTNRFFNHPNILIMPNTSDTSSKSEWCSSEIPNSWVEVVFPRHKIQLTQYTLTSRKYTDMNFPKSWKLDASFDNRTWTNLGEEPENGDLNGTALRATRSVTNNEFFKIFRFTMLGNNTGGLTNFVLSKIELYGSRKKDDSVLKSYNFACSCYNQVYRSRLFAAIFLSSLL